jgi:hypothetical protein
LFDALLTPLSDDGENANMVLGTFTFEWDFGESSGRNRIVEPDEAALAKALLLTHLRISPQARVNRRLSDLF